MCVSTLHAATGAIEKTKQLIKKLAPTATLKKQTTDLKANAVDEPSNKPVEEDIGLSTPKTTSKSAVDGNASPKKNQTSPKKQPPKQNGLSAPEDPKEVSIANLEDSLKDVVKLTPSKNVSKKNAEVSLLFGAIITDSENEEEDGDDNAGVANDVSEIFDCKFCDFNSKVAKEMKKHLREKHGQKRPRVLNCPQCPKSFGVLKTLNIHLTTHGVTEDKLIKKQVKSTANKKANAKEAKASANENKEAKTNAKEKGEVTVNDKENEVATKDAKEMGEIDRLAIFESLQKAAKNKALENVSNNDYTFAVQASNSSTPAKSVEHVKTANFECEICQIGMKTAKEMKAHIISTHNIDKPKIFKCEICGGNFMHKGSLDRHVKVKHSLVDGQQKITIKLPPRRKTIDAKPSATSKETQAAKAAKTPLRRKTVDVRPKAIEGSPIKVTSQSLIKEELMTPYKSIVKENSKSIKEEEQSIEDDPLEKFNESIVQNRLNEGESLNVTSSPSKKKSKVDNKTQQGTPKQKGFEELYQEMFNGETDSPGKEKSKGDSKIKGTPKGVGDLRHEQAGNTDSPNKKKKSKDDSKIQQGTPKQKTPEELFKEIFFEGTPDSPSKKKSKGDSKIESTPKGAAELLKEIFTAPTDSPSKKKSKANSKSATLDTSQAPVNGSPSPKKAGKRKSVPEVDTVDALESEQQQEEQVSEVIDLIDEVNTNVKPHKRIRLDTATDNSESQLSCGECNKVVTSRKRLDSHIKKKHSNSLHCPSCKVNFPGTLEYISHFASCTSHQGLPCGIRNCTKVFEGANYLSSHLKKKHKFT